MVRRVIKVFFLIVYYNLMYLSFRNLHSFNVYLAYFHYFIPIVFSNLTFETLHLSLFYLLTFVFLFYSLPEPFMFPVFTFHDI